MLREYLTPEQVKEFLPYAEEACAALIDEIKTQPSHSLAYAKNSTKLGQLQRRIDTLKRLGGFEDD